MLYPGGAGQFLRLLVLPHSQPSLFSYFYNPLFKPSSPIRTIYLPKETGIQISIFPWVSQTFASVSSGCIWNPHLLRFLILLIKGEWLQFLLETGQYATVHVPLLWPDYFLNYQMTIINSLNKHEIFPPISPKTSSSVYMRLMRKIVSYSLTWILQYYL